MGKKKGGGAGGGGGPPQPGPSKQKKPQEQAPPTQQGPPGQQVPPQQRPPQQVPTGPPQQQGGGPPPGGAWGRGQGGAPPAAAGRGGPQGPGPALQPAAPGQPQSPLGGGGPPPGGAWGRGQGGAPPAAAGRGGPQGPGPALQPAAPGQPQSPPGGAGRGRGGEGQGRGGGGQGRGGGGRGRGAGGRGRGDDRSSAPSPAPSASSVSSGSSQKPRSAADKPQMQLTKTEAVFKYNLPKRKGVGKEGRPITVEINFFPMKLPTSGKPIVHYDVMFDPDKPKFMFRKIMEQFRLDNYRNRFPAFDGKKNLYSMDFLPFGNNIEKEVTVFNEEKNENKTWKVTIQLANTLDVRRIQDFIAGKEPEIPRDALQALDVALRSQLTLKSVVVGRSFFTPPAGEIVNLGDGLELWHGFFQSAVIGWKPFLNVDVAHKGFPRQEHILDTWCGNLQIRDPRDYNSRDHQRGIQTFESYVKGLKVEYMLPQQPNTKRIFRVLKCVRSARDQTFTKENTTMSVEQYFRVEKKINLQFPTLPLLHVGPPQKTIFVPMEFCKIIPGQAINRKLNERQTSVMVKSAATAPFIRKRKIMDSLNIARYNDSPTAKEFGLSIDTKFQRVNGRVMQPPALAYGSGPVSVSGGVWRAGRFHQGRSLERWTIVNLTRVSPNELSNFANLMSTEGRKLGMNINNRPEIKSLSAWGERLIGELDRVFAQLKAGQEELVVVVIQGSGDTYGKVKQRAEIHSDILTQCIKDSTFRRMSPMTVGNILQKVNSKLNGFNHSLGTRPPILEAPCMIIGADVTHPSPDATSIPSIAAVVASHDPKAVQYNIELRLQPPREEVILDFKNIIKSQLMFFYHHTKQKPQKIIYYRDGVSDGQFQQVLAHELKAIRDACAELNADYKPPITFLVVQKRHHARFFPTDKRDEEGRSGNVPAGTIVDTEIVHPHEMDFYLVSHTGIQGTSRPTKYHLLWDDSDMSPDDLEKLTYFLCHLFMRCTRSVSYPTPTYYAHLAAFRGRAYLEGKSINLDRLHEEQKHITENMKQRTPMFFV